MLHAKAPRVWGALKAEGTPLPAPLLVLLGLLPKPKGAASTHVSHAWGRGPASHHVPGLSVVRQA